LRATVPTSRGELARELPLFAPPRCSWRWGGLAVWRNRRLALPRRIPTMRSVSSRQFSSGTNPFERLRQRRGALRRKRGQGALCAHLRSIGRGPCADLRSTIPARTPASQPISTKNHRTERSQFCELQWRCYRPAHIPVVRGLLRHITRKLTTTTRATSEF
jgi:hypothetical protein